jgi:raffinose/stachyose/melibiose transport system permease protein
MQLPLFTHNKSHTRKKNKKDQRSKDRLVIILFLLPALTLFFLFVIYPIFRSIYYSMFDWKGFGPAVDFIGLGNYKKILNDAVFLKSIKNVLLIITLSLSLQLPIALILAVLVGRDLPGRSFFRTVFFLPYVLSEVNTGIMWMLLYNPDPERGFLNSILVLIGLQPVTWLADMNVVIYAVFITLTWKYFGFHMMLYLTGFQNIPREIEEAARIDGANAVQNFFRITLPLLSSTIKTSVYMSVLGSIQQFVLIWVMTRGGPVNASETMATYMYRFGFVRFQLGYGAAVAIIMFILCMIFSLFYQALTRKPDYLSGL